MSWRNSTNQTAQPSSLSNVNNFINSVEYNDTSPIDIFYLESQEYLKKADTTFFTQYSCFGPLLLVGLVSITENYFRNLISKILDFCPISKKLSIDCNIKLGSVLWDTNKNFGRSALEHISFADSTKIVQMSEKLIGHKIIKNGSVETVLTEFAKICEIRHSIVHAGNHLASLNAVSLQITPTGKMPLIKVEYQELQDVADICTNLVISYNTEVFEMLCRRWAVKWDLQPNWDYKMHCKSFKNIWNCFFSKIDNNNGSIPTSLTMIKCRNKVKKEFSNSP